jgi:hypothetical protein
LDGHDRWVHSSSPEHHARDDVKVKDHKDLERDENKDCGKDLLQRSEEVLEEWTDTHDPEDAQQRNEEEETLNSSFAMQISDPAVDIGCVGEKENEDLKETEDVTEELLEPHEGEADRHLEREEDHEGSLPDRHQVAAIVPIYLEFGDDQDGEAVQDDEESGDPVEDIRKHKGPNKFWDRDGDDP